MTKPIVNHNQKNIKDLQKLIAICRKTDHTLTKEDILEHLSAIFTCSEQKNEKEWYNTWVPLALKFTKSKYNKYSNKYDFNSALSQLYGVVYKSGVSFCDLLSNDDIISSDTEQESLTLAAKAFACHIKQKKLALVVKVFVHVVWFCDQINLDPATILSASVFDCEMEEYGATESLKDFVGYNSTEVFLNKESKEHQDFLNSLYEVWGTFNIFYAKKDICSPEEFNACLLAQIEEKI